MSLSELILKKFLSLSIGLLFCTLLFQTGFSDEEQWGKVSREILEMRTFSKDSSADALILFDKGEIIVGEDFTINVHRRIKILSDEGQKLATMILPLGTSSVLLDFKAQTIQPSGQVLECKNIQDMKIKKLTIAKKIIFPGAVPGSVLEFKYVLLMENVLKPPTWYFQNDFYTLKSELIFKIPEGFVFNVLYTKPRGLKLEPLVKETMYYREYKWTLYDIKPFKPEPFMLPPINYLISARFSFQAFHQWYAHFGFPETWFELNNMFLKKTKKFYDADKKIKNLITSLNLDSLSPDQKIKRIYNYVLKNIKSYPFYLIGYSQTASEILHTREALQSDKNLLLLYLLKSAGIKAFPILISSRHHGLLNPSNPDIDSFDRLLVYVDHNGKKFLLNPSDEKIPYNLVDPEKLVNVGFVIKKDMGKFVNLKPFRKMNKTIIQSSFVLERNGILRGETQLKFDDYKAFEKRSALQEHSLEELAKDMLGKIFSDFVLDTVICKNQDSIDKPFYLILKYHILNYLEENGGKYIITIPFLTRISENPFKQDNRNYPIHFKYPEEIKEVINFKIDNYYNISDMPLKKIALFPGALMYKMKTMIQGNRCIITRHFKRKKYEFKVNEYQQLKQFYAKCINYDDFPILLEKSDDIQSTSERAKTFNISNNN